MFGEHIPKLGLSASCSSFSKSAKSPAWSKRSYIMCAWRSDLSRSALLVQFGRKEAFIYFSLYINLCFIISFIRLLLVSLDRVHFCRGAVLSSSSSERAIEINCLYINNGAMLCFAIGDSIVVSICSFLFLPLKL